MLTSFLFLITLTVGARASPTPLCSVRELTESPGYVWRVERVANMVDSATRIVRVTATSADSLTHIVRFKPLEWIRGAPSGDTITLPGTAVDRDDFNTGPVPYQMVRSAGQRGDCFAQEYRIGAQYLLLLQDRPGRHPIFWWSLGPVNEQLRGENDPWLLWVRARVANPTAVPR